MQRTRQKHGRRSYLSVGIGDDAHRLLEPEPLRSKNRGFLSYNIDVAGHLAGGSGVRLSSYFSLISKRIYVVIVSSAFSIAAGNPSTTTSTAVFPLFVLNLLRTLSSWGSSNYRPSAPFLYEVASHVKQLPFRPILLLLSLIAAFTSSAVGSSTS